MDQFRNVCRAGSAIFVQSAFTNCNSQRLSVQSRCLLFFFRNHVPLDEETWNVRGRKLRINFKDFRNSWQTSGRSRPTRYIVTNTRNTHILNYSVQRAHFPTPFTTVLRVLQHGRHVPDIRSNFQSTWCLQQWVLSPVFETQSSRQLCVRMLQTILFVPWRCGPTRTMASSFTRFLDHTQLRITVGRTPLDEWSARRRNLYLTTHNTHNRQKSMLPVGLEPTISAGEQPQTYALDRVAIGTGRLYAYHIEIPFRLCWG